ncbi:MAG: YdeI/OmpD-associated family protein [Candidatus Krumholzibacteriota bacterium]|nr:YdeI/OmpD-associated family protein [Candidatus Krumholzibacteriota bacterium]
MFFVPLKRVYIAERKEWRKWLETNHGTEPGIWLVYYKKASGKARISYDDAVEEAICFGWIDSTVKRIDEEKYMQKFTPRKPVSGWSRLNRERAEKMIASSLMTEAGLEKIESAKKNGIWESDGKRIIDPDIIPGDLEAALSKRKMALENFRNMAPSYRRNFIGWIEAAKREETRRGRIAETVDSAERNEKPGMK